MSFIDTISRDIAGSLRERDDDRLRTLRLLKTALVNRRVEKGRELDDPEALQVVAALVKQRREAIEQFGKAGRQDLVDREQAEIAVLAAYLPPAADAAEIARIVDESIAEVGATSPRDMGSVMKVVMARLAGRGADGREVSQLVKNRLSGNR
jgi:hypothetical protein